jgi:hypothetical protein
MRHRSTGSPFARRFDRQKAILVIPSYARWG